MPDSKAFFTVAQRAKRAGRSCLAHIALSGARCTRHRRFRGDQVALQFVIDTNYCSGNPAITALRRHFCHPRAALPCEVDIQCVNQQIRPFWRLYILPKRGWYE